MILLPGEIRSEDTFAEFSCATGIPLYDARLSLLSRRPRLFRRLDNEAEARRLSEGLARAAVGHYVVSESSVLSLPVGKASGVDLRDRHLEIRPQSGSELTSSIPFSDLLLVVRGEITRERLDEKRVGSMRNASRKLTPALRLHLYTREAALAVEIDPESFDFRMLGEKLTSSAILNFERLVGRLSEEIPDVQIDRGYDQEPVVLSRAGGASDVTDALSEGERGPEGVLYDDETSFRFYSRWMYRVTRHLDRRRRGA